MKRNEFLQLLKERILLLDGGYGTEFFKRGYGEIPGELLNLRAPEVVETLQREYVEAGADIILTNTFSANRPKLISLGFEEYFEEINARAVEIARRAGKDKTLVFGDLSSTGNFPRPLGSMNFEEAVQAFYEQARILYEAGVDGFIIETMSDIKELKAAVYGIRSVTRKLPIIANMTFDSSLRAVTGTSVAIFATTFEDLDVDVIGINCTLGPEEMINVFKELANYTTKPLLVEPNAGEPIYDGKKLSYKMLPEHFAIYVEDFVDLGTNIIGGCCGTSPEHIKVMGKLLSKRKPIQRKVHFTQALTSRTVYRTLEPFAVIGERINPASRKKFQEEIVEKNFQTLLKEAAFQEKKGATLLDVNLGIEKLLTEEHFKDAVIKLDRQSSIPISFDIQTSNYLEVALREYPGRPLINSARVTEKSLESRIELLKKYGGMLILLAMGKEIPKTPEERFKKILEGISILEENGISKERVLADPLVLSLGAKKDPYVTLETVRLLTEAGIKTTMGLSNLSFGLPNRSYINGAFLAQAIEKGLTSAIMNPGDSFVMGSLQGSLALKGKKITEEEKVLTEDPMVEALLSGNFDQLRSLVEKELEQSSPLEVSQNILRKAMEEIGVLYTEGKIYLPQLLLASETAQPIFDFLNSFISEEKTYKGKVVLATVEGDIHDIGKKIVGTVLKSGGFEVIDAGKDVPAEEILKIVKKERPDILGLSAMMTTTVGRVEEVAALLKQENVKVKLIAGGASMNSSLAKKFGCDGYAQNASDALILCKDLIGC
ncbi:homocysteine methyltransferase [Anoxybacter fermentans]|uniref:Methionine synthase n=1 Tax=Anoxybacter fermentans TaxID=1323375 RepID=A0A3Q9HPH4_9FIRM|nr:homocysteine S-methyltransferase family protein [Anoxybacter fermentans]AZR72689.1 homocysteine methyltransferase [Anoxybacter fermentans]